MKKIFENARLGPLEIPNRLVRSATFERGCIKDGVIQSAFLHVIEELAQGGIGLIITGTMSVLRNSEANGETARTYDESFIKNFASIADAVHKTPCKIAVQLGHIGVKAKGFVDNDSILCPSDIQFDDGSSARAMTRDDINKVAAAFGTAALRCKEAGADGVQIHAAHGYLITQFLSPYYNKRTDEYGAGIKNRARFLFDIYDAIRANVGASYPVLMKINYTDLIEPGITPDEAVWVCGELSERGIDAIEVSGGVGLNSKTSPSQRGFAEEGFFASNAAHVASRVSCPVIAVGGFRTPEKIEEWLNKGNFEAAALSRPFIREPALANRWKNGGLSKAACISCSKCFLMEHLGCFVETR
ncbi:MAG: NADH:flavin oxidoreductase [Treponemataceae bacterium]|nr:MAG: NADH:flavin oxidoreductase [Treponemataceae bacterium]